MANDSVKLMLVTSYFNWQHIVILVPKVQWSDVMWSEVKWSEVNNVVPVHST
jgi:hypothetical protein